MAADYKPNQLIAQEKCADLMADPFALAPSGAKNSTLLGSRKASHSLASQSVGATGFEPAT